MTDSNGDKRVWGFHTVVRCLGLNPSAPLSGRRQGRRSYFRHLATDHISCDFPHLSVTHSACFSSCDEYAEAVCLAPGIDQPPGSERENHPRQGRAASCAAHRPVFYGPHLQVNTVCWCVCQPVGVLQSDKVHQKSR